MGWASKYIERLAAGDSVQFRPRGNSMSGKIEDGDLVTVSPCDGVEVGDIVLCKVKGSEYLHLVKAKSADRFQIGNNKGHINGWVKRSSIFGKVTSIGEGP